VNHVHLAGNLGRDPETFTTESGLPIVTLSVATTSRRKVGDDYEKVTDWHRVKVFGKSGEAVAKHFRKGDGILIHGRISYSKSEKDGEVRYFTDIIASDWSFAPGRKGGNTGAPEPYRPSDGQDGIPF